MNIFKNNLVSAWLRKANTLKYAIKRIKGRSNFMKLNINSEKLSLTNNGIKIIGV